MAEARGQPLDKVCRLIGEDTREPSEDLVARCVREDKAVRRTHQALLVNRAGSEFDIEYSAAPTGDESGDFAGAVLVR